MEIGNLKQYLGSDMFARYVLFTDGVNDYSISNYVDSKDGVCYLAGRRIVCEDQDEKHWTLTGYQLIREALERWKEQKPDMTFDDYFPEMWYIKPNASYMCDYRLEDIQEV